MKRLLMIVFILGSMTAYSQEADELDQAAAEKPVKSKKVLPKVLDFEAEVIEGERKTPNLFLQLEMETPNLDTVMYQRKNFNDFFQVELDRKPSYKAPDR